MRLCQVRGVRVLIREGCRRLGNCRPMCLEGTWRRTSKPDPGQPGAARRDRPKGGAAGESGWHLGQHERFLGLLPSGVRSHGEDGREFHFQHQRRAHFRLLPSRLCGKRWCDLICPNRPSRSCSRRCHRPGASGQTSGLGTGRRRTATRCQVNGVPAYPMDFLAGLRRLVCTDLPIHIRLLGGLPTPCPLADDRKWCGQSR